ncbi:MAG: protein kinase domain-containing protein, partial [Bryobacteraceae bacterium]
MATTQMIRTEPLQTQPRWTSLSGTILEGGYELQDLLEATDTEARFKVRVLGDRELESVASIFQMAEAEIERQVELWQNVRMLRHPNLSAPLGAGRLQLDGVPLAYVVLRRADEALAAVLSTRSLTADEAGEALTSVARALEALHLQGWVHGCVSPDLVLAVGDYIQLPGECVRTVGVAPAAETITAKYLAPESVRANLAPETDLWCLGATIFEALTQKVWTEESREELGALPEPFATIALRCLETDPKTRCSLAEIIALYRGELKLPPRVKIAAASSVIVSK